MRRLDGLPYHSPPPPPRQKLQSARNACLYQLFFFHVGLAGGHLHSNDPPRMKGKNCQCNSDYRIINHNMARYTDFRLTFVLLHLGLFPNGKCLAIIRDQTLFAGQTWWCWTEYPTGIKPVWTNRMFYNVWLNVCHCSNLVAKQCLIMFDHPAFPAWTGLYSICKCAICCCDLPAW